jgi:hypothetical protein
VRASSHHYVTDNFMASLHLTVDWHYRTLPGGLLALVAVTAPNLWRGPLPLYDEAAWEQAKALMAGYDASLRQNPPTEDLARFFPVDVQATPLFDSPPEVVVPDKQAPTPIAIFGNSTSQGQDAIISTPVPGEIVDFAAQKEDPTTTDDSTPVATSDKGS